MQAKTSRKVFGCFDFRPFLNKCFTDCDLIIYKIITILPIVLVFTNKFNGGWINGLKVIVEQTSIKDTHPPSHIHTKAFRLCVLLTLRTHFVRSTITNIGPHWVLFSENWTLGAKCSYTLVKQLVWSTDAKCFTLGIKCWVCDTIYYVIIMY